MKKMGEVLKESANKFAERMIRKKYPNLADVEFELEQRMGPCPGCDRDVIPEFYIKRESDHEFKKVPIKNENVCIQCEDKQLARNAVANHKRLKREQITNQFWMVPPELDGATLTTYAPADGQQKSAWETAVNYANDFKSGDPYNLMFRGTYGGGKSHLLKGIAEIVRKTTTTDEQGDEIPFTVGFLEFDRLLAMIKGTWGRREGETENDIIQKAIELDFLVIDDLGTESGEWAGKMLFSIVNGRQGKPTAYSTNFMEMGELAERFGPNGGKITSRLHSNTKIIDLVTKDMRMEKLKNRG